MARSRLTSIGARLNSIDGTVNVLLVKVLPRILVDVSWSMSCLGQEATTHDYGDEKGQKFSKTKGIGFDPLEIIENHGADALRMAMVIGNPPGNDLKIEEEKVIAYRNFGNKIWNMGRFILMNLEASKKKVAFYDSKMDSKLTKEDKEILKDLNKLIKETTRLIEKYRFDLAAEGIYHFLCRWIRMEDRKDCRGHI